MAKYIILGAVVSAGHIYLAILAVIASLIGVVYYFKPIILMFTPAEALSLPAMTLGQKIIIGILTALTLLIGLFPDSLIRIAVEI